MPSNKRVMLIDESKATSNQNVFATEIVFNEKLIKTDSNGIIMGKLKIAVSDAFLLALPDIDAIMVNIITNKITPNNRLTKNRFPLSNGNEKNNINSTKLMLTINPNSKKL
jgi:hypothetical protein